MCFFSAVLFILQLCGVNDSCIKIIGLILGLAIIILLGLSSKYSNEIKFTIRKV